MHAFGCHGQHYSETMTHIIFIYVTYFGELIHSIPNAWAVRNLVEYTL